MYIFFQFSIFRFHFSDLFVFLRPLLTNDQHNRIISSNETEMPMNKTA